MIILSVLAAVAVNVHYYWLEIRTISSANTPGFMQQGIHQVK